MKEQLTIFGAEMNLSSAQGKAVTQWGLVGEEARVTLRC